MTGQEFSDLLRRGERVYGTHVVSTSPWWPRAVVNAGVDFVFIDTEHVPIDRNTLSWMCQAYQAAKLPAIVRIPSPDPVQAGMVLDGGATGVIAPYVESAAQVRELVGAVKLRPLKGTRRSDILSGGATAEPELNDYIQRNNANSLVIVNIESVPAMEHLDEILDVPGLDGVLIGPHDLAASLGIPDQYRNPVFDDAVREITRKARQKNLGAGIHFWAVLDLEIQWAQAGINMLIHSGDIAIFETTLRDHLTQIRSALGDDGPGGDKEGATVV